MSYAPKCMVVTPMIVNDCKTGARISGPPLERTKGPACESTKLSLAYVTVTSRGAAHWGVHTLY